jgi:hypothetical protein
MKLHVRQWRIRWRGRLAAGVAGAIIAALAGCGGGSSSTMPAIPGTAASAQMVQVTSANAVAVPSAAMAATSATLTTSQAAVAIAGARVIVTGNSATATVACPGGGTVVFTVTGPTPANFTDGQLDAGETFTLAFGACKGKSGGASVTGVMTLAVIAATTDSLTVHTTTNAVVVTLPNGTVTLNGSSTLVQTVATSRATVTTIDHWTAPSYSVTTAFNGRSDTFSMTDVDITATTTVTNGTLASTTYQGTMTLSANLSSVSFSITIATQGQANYDGSGTPTQGTWLLTFPFNAITLTIAAGMVTIGVDYGADGTIDQVYTFTIGTLEAYAG